MENNRIIVCNQEFDNAVRKGELYFEGDIFEKDGHCFYFRHFLYELDKSIEEYFHVFIKDKKSFVKQLKGEFCLIDYNIEQNLLFVATDHLGKEAPLIYENNGLFLITNDFWRGVEIIKPTEQDIDWQTIKEMTIHSVGILHSTIIKHYLLMPAATLLEINLNKTVVLNYEFYWDFRFKADINLRLEDAVDRMYEIFDETFALMAKKFSPETRFGVGVSGGWDSRLIVAFAQKYNLKLVPFCVGSKYSIFPLQTNGYRVVKKITKYFHLDNFTFIPHNKESYIEKIQDDVLLAPNKGSELAIGCRSAIPDYDVMLNGEHGGVFLGEFKWRPLLEYNNTDIYKHLLALNSWNIETDMIFSKEERECLENKMKDYVISLDSENRDEIFYRYFFEVLAPRTKCGFFETNYTKERYSPYLNPDLMEFWFTWDSRFFADRIIQRRFFMKYFKDVSKMQDEEADAPLFWRDMNIRYVPMRLFFAMKNVIFQSSMQRAKWLRRDKGFHALLNRTLENQKETLEKHFPNLDIKKFFKENPRSTANLVKMLIEADVILNYQVPDKRAFIREKYGKNK